MKHPSITSKSMLTDIVEEKHPIEKDVELCSKTANEIRASKGEASNERRPCTQNPPMRTGSSDRKVSV
jgi:hypothetical protein